MTPRDFAYWLHGFFELCDDPDQDFSHDQLILIRKKFEDCFPKVDASVWIHNEMQKAFTLE